MPEFEVRLYSPFSLKQFLVTIDAPSKDEAEKRMIGRTVTDPDFKSFEVEDYYIIGVYPSSRVPLPPYRTLPLNHAEPPKWSLGTRVIEEKPLPAGAEPIGSPYLKKMVEDALYTLVYEQEVRSKEYPDITFHIQFEKDLFTKFLNKAKSLVDERQYKEAIFYLVEHNPDLTVQNIADALALSYHVIYDRLKELLAEGKVVESGVWRGQTTYGPKERKTEVELLEELEKILTLETGKKPTLRELEPYRKVLRRKKRKELQQNILSYFEQTT